MLFSIRIYAYAVILVIGSLFTLQRAKRLYEKPSTEETRESIFATPQNVSMKVIKATGTEVHVTGREKIPDGAVLYVANHQGLFDILAFLGHLGKPVGFIAKQEIKKLPIIRTWMGLLNCVFIDRSDRRQSMKAINQGIENLKQGSSLVIFPEGTRGKGTELSEFKPGSLRLATKANVPIVPVTLNGTYQMLEAGNGRVKGSTITMTIHDPIFPSKYQELKSAELAKELQEIVQSALPHIATTNEIDKELVTNTQ
ncbi:lysophospholipid acyltransferase family protein [Ornithinibacillus halotolerans]|uniref:1-acyl-sn-glycerol-3-phosphate acyltransferase n=1 Tax=Ornithinibacillus halotolerans TaxID=1274357 RepID=A0A916S9Y0_9BACI|nr:lysophospholipid acyltransferase family protein [Ornithinibacillus halotolerans]GGA89053.1 1-acyl-sn-glycerol-3-phosphate acyltransferase [Ornithinibacillus halotolerans]